MKPKACVIERNLHVRSKIVEMLEVYGYEVEPYEDPSYYPMPKAKPPESEANDYLRLDVLICELNLRIMDGLEFTELLLNSGFKIDNIALIIDEWLKDYEQVAEELGYKVLKKPIKLVKLAEWLEECQQRQSIKEQIENKGKARLRDKKPGADIEGEESRD